MSPAKGRSPSPRNVDEQELIDQAHALVRWFRSQEIERDQAMRLMMGLIASHFTEHVETEAQFRQAVRKLWDFVSTAVEKNFEDGE